jgi:membrane protein DedA with SNARE-associated domain
MIPALASLQAFGPAAIFLGSGLEGQTVAIAGGVMARMGLINWPLAVAAACAGSAVMDQMLFFLGRYGRSTRFVTKMAAKPAFARAAGFIEGHPIGFVMSFRFIFGLRAAGPVAAGLSAMGMGLFAGLNLASAAVWAGLFSGGGFIFGETLQRWLEHPTLKGEIVAGSIGLAFALGIAALALWRPRPLPAAAVTP